LRLEAPSRQAIRALSTKPGIRINESSRFVKEEQEQQVEDDVSPFKRHRQKELQEDQKSEDPLYPEAYPRLESSSIRKSVPEFLQESQDELSSEPVTLSGRIRSKRVVGNSLIFLDITNEFQKVQIMINKSKVAAEQESRVHKFRLLKNLIQVGDHICRPIALLLSLYRG
jgi:lysyl-tRNA synthetase class 2